MRMDGHLMGIQSKKDGKRKRSSSEVSQTHDAKRTATGDTIKNGPSGEMARRRQEIRRLYESYLLLSSKASKGDLRAFEHLLSRTKGLHLKQAPVDSPCRGIIDTHEQQLSSD